MITSYKAEFPSYNLRRKDAPAGSLARFPGAPVEVAGHADWRITSLDFGRRRDVLDFVNSDMAPTPGADGLEWESDVIVGGTTTLAAVVSSDPHLRITTPATDTQGIQFQGSVGGRTLYDPSVLEEFFMYARIRFADASDNAATISQMRFGMGFAPVDTTIFTAVDDALALHKADGSSLLRLVSDDDSVDLASYTQQATVQDLSVGSRSGGVAANIWLGIGIHAVVGSQSNNAGILHAYYDVHRASSVQRRDPTHKVSMEMVEVPDQALAPFIAFAAGEAVAKQLHISKIVLGAKYRLGV